MHRLLHPKELIVDSFAGGGGASLGILKATGRHPDIAINHDSFAIEMHKANHPKTLHVLEDVWKADLRGLVAGRPVGLLWASPDCRHFSRAKGSAPVSKSIRSLAWTVVRWAEQVKPLFIFLENVREFTGWGPIVPAWKCDCGWKGTEGQAALFRKSRRCPRCDGRRLVQVEEMVPCPERKGQTFQRFCARLKKLNYEIDFRTLDAADFGDPTHRKRLFFVARRDGEKVCWPSPTHGPGLIPWKTAASCIDWSIPAPSIFDRKRPLAEATQRRIAKGIKRYVLDSPSPFLVPITHRGDDRVYSGSEPFRTVTGANGGEVAMITPTFSPGEGQDYSPRVAAFIAKHFGGMVGIPITHPLPTTTSRGTQNQLVTANLIHMNHGEKQWSSIDAPCRTLTTSNHAAVVYSFLSKYFGTATGSSIDHPMPTCTQKDRFALVTVNVMGEDFVLSDIGMRMLTPRELARAQGFPDDYILPGKSKSKQIRAIGNSVCHNVAAAIIRSNLASENYASQEVESAFA